MIKLSYVERSRPASVLGALAAAAVHTVGYMPVTIPSLVYDLLVAGVISVIFMQVTPNCQRLRRAPVIAKGLYAVCVLLWVALGLMLATLTVRTFGRAATFNVSWLVRQWISSGCLVLYVGRFYKLSYEPACGNEVDLPARERDSNAGIQRVIKHPFAIAFVVCLAAFELSQAETLQHLPIAEWLSYVGGFGMILSMLFGGIALMLGGGRAK